MPSCWHRLDLPAGHWRWTFISGLVDGRLGKQLSIGGTCGGQTTGDHLEDAVVYLDPDLRHHGCAGVDAGKEFSEKLMQKAASQGIVTHQIAAKAPWQQGRTERHGAHYKDLLQKARAETVVSSSEELKMLMNEVELAKNRFSNRSGYSPIQRQIGQWPRMAGSGITDDLVDVSVMEAAVGDDMERLLEMRRIAQKAFVEHNARKIAQKLRQARSRVPQSFSAGDYVYVYRVPHQRKRKVGGPDGVDRTVGKPYWVGPGTVVTVDGASLWISMFGQLWKAVREQCRVATNPEKQGIEIILSDCKELVEEYRKTSNRAGFRDLTDEPWPKRTEEEKKEEEERGGEIESHKRPREELQEDEEEAVDRRRIEHELPIGEEEEYTPTVRSERTDGQTPAIEVPGSEGMSEELDAEIPGAASERQVETPSASASASIGRSGIHDAYRRSIEAADRLDDIPPYGQPARWRSSRRGPTRDPYFQEFHLTTEEERHEEEEDDRAEWLEEAFAPPTKAGFWELMEGGRILRRHHLKKRKSAFDPRRASDMPCLVEGMAKERRTVKKFTQSGRQEEVHDRWDQKTTKDVMWWRGYTDFEVIDVKNVGRQEEEKRTTRPSMCG